MGETKAQGVYEAELVPLDEGQVKRIARGLWAAVAGWPPGLIPLPTVAHLVISERATGRTIYRRPVDPGEAGGILTYVHERMATDTPEHFRATVGDLYYSPATGPHRS
jgi:hypothetical protein